MNYIIHSLEKVVDNDVCKIIAKITLGEQECQTLWFETEAVNEKMIVTDRSDAILVCLLPDAITYGYNIVSEIPISESLLYHIRFDLMPALCSDKKHNEISIKAASVSDLSENEVLDTPP